MAITNPLNQEDELQPATGIVSSVAQPAAIEPQPAQPMPPPVDQYKAPTMAPISTQVAPEGETVESRLGDLTAKGSRYTELARKDAIREANTRGLINTTMAGAAGTEAAIRAALPIAQQDARTMTETRMANQRAQNEFLKNRQSANLNMEVAEFDSTLNTNFEKTMQDERFSDESKIQMVTTMNNIVRDTQAQITEIGLSDRSAAQQASAIDLINKMRDAELAVYQDLLSSFNDWEWGIDFTPGTEGTTGTQMLEPKPPPPSNTGGFFTGLSPDGDWTWDRDKGDWVLHQ